MSCLYDDNHELTIEQVQLKEIAEQFGTPTYVYSREAIEKNWRMFDEAFQKIKHLICYSVKANSNLAILNLLAKLHSGFDIVSLGELERVKAAGGDLQKVIFSGVGKKSIEIDRALRANIYCFNVESLEEIERIAMIAESQNKVANIALRINPNVNPNTHLHISTGLSENKFGLELDEMMSVTDQIANYSSIKLIGIASHIGSQITELAPFLQTLDRLIVLYKKLIQKNFSIQHINIGGGLGITYHEEEPPAIFDYAKAIQDKLSDYPVEIVVEPGRAIVGNAGVLLTRVEYLKHHRLHNFAIVDAGMNDLIRPALYSAWHDILPVSNSSSPQKKRYDIAGPVCESADFFGKDRELSLKSGDLLVIDSAGAYGFSMSSNYNSRCRPAEVLVDDDKAILIRRRETIEELFSHEIITATNTVT